MLNRNEMLHGGKITTREKEIKEIEVKGEIFYYDPNSMALSKSTIEASDDAPFWELSPTPAHKGYLCFQATYACNLACVYCFVKHHYCDQSNTIDLDTMIDAVYFFQPNFVEQGFNIGWFGGEPILNWENIVQFVEWAKTKAAEIEAEKKLPAGSFMKKSHFHVTTNATLITPEIADYLAQHNFSMIVSLDGKEADHNEFRPYAGDYAGNSFQDTMRGLGYCASAYKKHGKQNPITLRSTFDQHGCDLVERLQFLNQLKYDGFAGHVSVEPSCLAESCARNTFEGITIEEIYGKFMPQYYAAADWFLAEIRAGKNPAFHHFGLPLQRIYDRQPAPSECGAGKGYISVGPNGKTCACHREHESEIGNMYEGLDDSKIAGWNDNRYFNRIGCNDCWMRNICGGGCRCNSALLYKNLWQPSAVECKFNEMRTVACFYLLGKMTKQEKDTFSKQKPKHQQKNRAKKIGVQAKTVGFAEPHPCSNPNQCDTCADRLKERTQMAIVSNPQTAHAPKKLKPPICGLMYCEGNKCPFPKCAEPSKEEMQAVMATLTERGSDNKFVREMQ